MSEYMLSKWLSSAKYHYQAKTKQDIMNVLEMYRNLRPSMEKCTLPTGVKRDLIVLKGTIPITYRQNVYNIPISMWILNNHPDSAPICWVNPTKDMTIKVSKHVDASGRVYLPYLSDWNPESSDLLGVIQVMIIIFGEQPPLYSKPKSNNPVAFPNSGSESFGGYPNASSGGNNPPYPTQFPNQNPFPNFYPAVNSITPTSNSYPAPTTDPSSNSTFSYPSFPMMPTPNYSPQQPGVPSAKPINADTITKEHIRLSLLSAVEDKLKSRSKEILSQHKAEIDVLKRTSEDLNKGRSKLDNLVKEIEKNFMELIKCKENIIKKDAKLSELVSKLESSENSLNIDEYFGPVQPLYKQLFNAFVEENAIIDTIFHLNEALRKSVIDLDVFIKYIRELSRRQFMLRALVKLCREKAGLPT